MGDFMVYLGFIDCRQNSHKRNSSTRAHTVVWPQISRQASRWVTDPKLEKSNVDAFKVLEQRQTG
jgi:hypothetical protein